MRERERERCTYIEIKGNIIKDENLCFTWYFM